MVMTERSKPGMSVMGMALTVCVAAAAVLSAPLFACPPEEAPSAQRTARPTMNRTPRAVMIAPVAPTPPVPPSPPAPPAPPGSWSDDASTYERYMKERSGNPFAPGAMGDDNGDLRQRLEMLEQRLNRLSEHLQQLLGSQEGLGGHGGALMPKMPAQGMSSGGAFVAPRVMAMPGQGGAVAIAPAQGSGEFAMTFPRSQGGVSWAGAAEGESISRFYSLDGGKLEALTELMSRADVPVLVTPRDDGIEVHGTPRQQEIFAAFVALINPDGNQIPLGGRSDAGGLLRREVEAARAMAKQRVDQTRAASRKAVEERQRAIETQRSRLRSKAQELYRKSQELEGRADAMTDEADDKEGVAHDYLMAQADALYAQASAMEAEADGLEEAADQLDEEIDALHAQSDEMDAEIDEALSQALEALELEATTAAQIADSQATARAAMEAELAAAAAEAAAVEAEAAAEAVENESEEDDGGCR